MKTSCCIYDNKVIAVILGVLDTLFYYLSWVYLTHFKYCDFGSLSHNFQLFDSRRSVNVGCYKQRTLALFLEHLRKLCSVCCFT